MSGCALRSRYQGQHISANARHEAHIVAGRGSREQDLLRHDSPLSQIRLRGCSSLAAGGGGLQRPRQCFSFKMRRCALKGGAVAVPRCALERLRLRVVVRGDGTVACVCVRYMRCACGACMWCAHTLCMHADVAVGESGACACVACRSAGLCCNPHVTSGGRVRELAGSTAADAAGSVRPRRGGRAQLFFSAVRPCPPVTTTPLRAREPRGRCRRHKLAAGPCHGSGQLQWQA